MLCCLELPLKTPGCVCFVSSLQLFQSAHTIPQAGQDDFQPGLIALQIAQR